MLTLNIIPSAPKLSLQVERPSVPAPMAFAGGMVMILPPPVQAPVELPPRPILPEVDSTWTVIRIAREARPYTWEQVFAEADPELLDVSRILDEQERIYGPYFPLKSNLFSAFHLTPLPETKVVILGQDPYHQSIVLEGRHTPRAVGLSFSVHPDDVIPSSLTNIYAVLHRTIRDFVKPDHGDLREWAHQGVLMLNMCLTVRAKTAGAHGEIWMGFINRIFKAISAVNPTCIFLLWGREAQKVKPMLGERFVVLETSHPSGLSARRGFLECDHFNQTNAILTRQGKTPIDWRLSSREELRRRAGVPSAAPTTSPEPVGQFASANSMLPQAVYGERAGERAELKLSTPSEWNDIPIPIIPNTRESLPVDSRLGPVGGSLMSNLTQRRSSMEAPIWTPEAPAGPAPTIPTIQFGASARSSC